MATTGYVLEHEYGDGDPEDDTGEDEEYSMVSVFETKLDKMYTSMQKYRCLLDNLDLAAMVHKRKRLFRECILKLIEKTKK